MFTNSSSPASGSSPDVANTPNPAGLVPIAYVNSALAATHYAKVVMIGINLHFAPGVASFAGENLISNELITSSGNEPGGGMGVVSGMLVADASGKVLGSAKTFNGVAPASRMLNANAQNPANVPGASQAPAQVKVTVLV